MVHWFQYETLFYLLLIEHYQCKHGLSLFPLSKNVESKRILGATTPSNDIYPGVNAWLARKVNGYDQEIPQSKNTDKSMAPQERAT